MSKSRKPWLDIIRATAILCVVLCHSVEAFYRPVLLGQLRLSFPFWNIENLLFTVGRIGVPLFLATTGALMLPRDYPDVSAFYKKSLFPLFLTTEIWIFFNYIFYCLIASLKKTFAVGIIKKIMIPRAYSNEYCLRFEDACNNREIKGSAM